MSSPGPSDFAGSNFVETLECRRFAEFCDACRRYRYIGLCYGRPGVGKTLSARHYTRWDLIEDHEPYAEGSSSQLRRIAGSNVVFYTPTVVNSPGQVEHDIGMLRGRLRGLLMEDLSEKQEAETQEAIAKEEEARAEFIRRRDRAHERFSDFSGSNPSVVGIARTYARHRQEIKDPTSLVVIDEADRLKMASLEQIRDTFDRGEIGLVLIGMPGLEKRLARYPQFYSRIGFVHEYRPLGVPELRQLLGRGWTPPGVRIAGMEELDAEAAAAIIRVTGGNFRLLDRLLTQVERVLEINRLDRVTRAAVEAARESLVIGQV
jgi:DNA transposition AAA+ family ATPase